MHVHRSPFILCCLPTQDLEVLRLVLEAGCPPNLSEEERGGAPCPAWSALHHACHKGYGTQAVELLVGHGADMLYADMHGMTPLAFTANQGVGGICATAGIGCDGCCCFSSSTGIALHRPLLPFPSGNWRELEACFTSQPRLQVGWTRLRC